MIDTFFFKRLIRNTFEYIKVFLTIAFFPIILVFRGLTYLIGTTTTKALSNCSYKLMNILSSALSFIPFVGRYNGVINGSRNAEIIASTAGYFGGEALFSLSKDSLVSGDLKSSAEKRWPIANYLQYWLDAPEDMRRSPITDGRLADGTDPSKSLSDPYIDDDLVKDAVQKALVIAGENALKTFSKFTFLSLIIPTIVVIFYSKYILVKSVAAVVNQNTDFLTSISGKSWYLSAYEVVAPFVSASFQSIINFSVMGIIFIASVLVLFICAIGIAHARFWSDFWNLHRNLIQYAANYKSSALRKMPKEAVTRFHHRPEIRRTERHAYVKSVKAVNSWDSREGVVLGTCTGSFAFRGHLLGPQMDQDFVLTDAARAQHVLVFGASGLGKTTKILKPLFKKDVSNIMASGGSIYVSDGKGDLYKDLLPVSKAAGLKSFVIGVQPGSYGVDLLQGTKPQMVADILASVLKQTSGAQGGGDPFWGAMRDHFIRCAGSVLEAYERTEAGKKWATKNGRRAYSLLNIYKATQQAIGPGSMLWEMMDAIKTAPEFTDPALFNKVGDIGAEGLWGSMEYIYGKWLNMSLNSPATLDGIQANVTASLSQFETQEDIRKNFASGEKSEFSIADMLDESMVVFTDLSSVSSGLCGKIVLVFLKNLVYLELRKRQMRDKKLADLHPLKIYFDEVQELITSDVTGISDTNFINIARSAMGKGGGFVVATQTKNALTMAVGEVAASNYIDNFSTIISMRHSEASTIGLLKSKAGQTIRSHAHGVNEVESLEYLRQQIGVDAANAGPARLGELAGIRRTDASFYANDDTSEFTGYDTPVPVDLRFIPGICNDSSNIDSVMSATSAAHNRAEDKVKDYFNGSLEDVLTDSDFSHLGDSQAVAVWVRGGHVRMDIVNLPEPMM